MPLPHGVGGLRSVRTSASAGIGSMELMLQVRVGGPVLLHCVGGRLLWLTEPELALHFLEQRRAEAQREPGHDGFHEELHDRNRSIAGAGWPLPTRALAFARLGRSGVLERER